MKLRYLEPQIKQRRLLLNLVLWVMATCSVGVQADEKAVLEEITVTARKVEENLQDVPISVVALSSSDIAARGLENLEDLALHVPNVNFSQWTGQAIISVRGIADQEHFVTSDPLVGVYVDGVYIARQQGGLLDLIDLERIEVLKGPQGTLFGKNTVGGAISVHSKKPQGEGDGYLKVTAGEDERMNFQGSYDFAITDDLSLSLSGLYKNRDCLLRRENDNACMGDEDIKVFRAHANYEPSDAFSAALILDGSWNDSHSQVNGVNVVDPAGFFFFFYNLARATDPTLPVYDPVGLGEPFVAEGNSPTDDDIQSLGASLQLEWDISDNLTVRSLTAYREFDAKANIEYDAFRATIFENTPLYTFSDQFSQELVLEGRAFDDQLNWLAGMYYFYEDARTDQTIRLPSSAFLGGFKVDPNSEAESISGFGHISYNLTERIRVSGGVRYTSETREFDSKASFLVAPGENGFLSPVSNKDTFTAWTPKITLDYKPSNDILLYASLSRGFRSGGFNGQTSQSDPNFVSFDPEYVLNYELGFKSTLWDQRIIFNTSAYFLDYTDKQFAFQILDPEDNTKFISVRDNAAKAEVIGVETDLKVALTEKLKLEAGFAFNDSEYTDLRDDAVGLKITLDSPFLYAPKYTANLAVQYMEPDFAGIGSTSLRVDTSYKSRIYFNDSVAELEDPFCGPLNYQDDYGIVNARITFSPHNTNWTLTAYGDNLTDKIIYSRAYCQVGSGFDTPSYGLPREVGVEVRFDF